MCRALAEPFFLQDISLLYFLFCKMALLDIYISENKYTFTGYFCIRGVRLVYFPLRVLGVTVPDDGHVFPGF